MYFTLILWSECFLIINHLCCIQLRPDKNHVLLLQHTFLVSVTEEEIHNGILSVDNVDTACYWFRRSLDGLAKNTQDKTARRYMDIGYDGKTDEEALNFLTKLKYVIAVIPQGRQGVTDHKTLDC